MAGETEERRNWLQRMLEGFMPRGIGGIFSTVFWMGLLAVGVYFIARVPAVQNWLREHLPDDWQAGLEGLLGNMGLSMFPGAVESYLRELPIEHEDAERTVAGVLENRGVPAEVAAILGESQETWTGFLDLVEEANRGTRSAAEYHITQDDLLSANTISAMLTRNPTLAGRLIGALPVPAAGTAPTGTTNDVLNAVRGLIADPTKLSPILTNDASRDVLAQAIVRFGPSMGITFRDGAAGPLSQFIALANQTDAAGFQQALTALLSGNAEQVQQGMVQLITIGAAHPAALNALIAKIDPASLPESARGLVTGAGAQAGQALGDQLGALRTAVGAEHAAAITQAMMADGQAGMIRYLRQHRDILPALITEARREGSPLAGVRDILPVLQTGTDRQLNAVMRLLDNGVNLTAMQGLRTTQDMVRYFMNPANLAQLDRRDGMPMPLGDLGTAMELFPGLPMQEFMTTKNQNNYVNVAAIFGMLRTVVRSPANQGNNAARAQRVMTGLLGALSGDAAAANTLTTEDVVGFFREPVNRQAFGEMLRRIDPSALDPQSQRIVRALAQNWGTGTDVMDGLAEALTDTNVAGRLVSGIKEFARNPNAPRGEIAEPNFFDRNYLRMLGVYDEVEALRQVLSGSGSSVAGSAPSPELQATIRRSQDPRSMGSMK